MGEQDMESHSGIMVAFKIPRALSHLLALEGGEPADILHITMMYFTPENQELPEYSKVVNIIRHWVAGIEPPQIFIDGLDSFKGKDGKVAVTWAKPVFMNYNPDWLLTSMVAAFANAGIEYSPTHPEFVPHITLAYDDRLKEEQNLMKERVGPESHLLTEMWVTYGDDTYETIQIPRPGKSAAWVDVQKRGVQLFRAKSVTALELQHNYIVANVSSTTGRTYECSLAFDSQGKVAFYGCNCEWGVWAYNRKTMVGRLCSHGYATLLEWKSLLQYM